MTEKYRTRAILSTLLVLLPMIMGMIMWEEIPAEVAIHFDMQGNPDGFAGKGSAVFAFPLLMMAVHIFTLFMVFHDPRHEDMGEKLIGLIFWIMPVVSILGSASIVSVAIGMPIDMTSFSYVALGVFYILMGRCMKESGQNFTAGIRTKWTLSSKENWKETHKFAKRLWIITGVMFILNSVMKASGIVLTGVLVSVIMPVIYSFALYKNGI